MEIGQCTLYNCTVKNRNPNLPPIPWAPQYFLSQLFCLMSSSKFLSHRLLCNAFGLRLGPCSSLNITLAYQSGLEEEEFEPRDRIRSEKKILIKWSPSDAGYFRTHDQFAAWGFNKNPLVPLTGRVEDRNYWTNERTDSFTVDIVDQDELNITVIKCCPWWYSWSQARILRLWIRPQDAASVEARPRPA